MSSRLKDLIVVQVEEFGPLRAKSQVIRAISEIENELMLHIPIAKVFPSIDGVLVVPDLHRII